MTRPVFESGEKVGTGPATSPRPSPGWSPGLPFIDLSVGTMSLIEHPPVLCQPSTHYSPFGGSPSLRAAVASFEDTPVEQVTITTGAMGALLTCLGLLDPGGTVLLPRPHFPAYPTLIRSFGHTPAYYELDTEPAGTLDDVIGRVGPGTAAVLWNFPHNPTGQVDDGIDLAGLAQRCADSGAVLLTDRVDEDVVFGLERRREPLLTNEIRIKSLSKMLGMAGERVGYAMADPERSAKIALHHWLLVSTPPAGSQSMVEAHMAGIESSLLRVRETIESHVSALARHLEGLDSVTWIEPRAGMFAWLRVTGMTSAEAVAVAADHGVTILGGPVFGVDNSLGFVRVNLGVDRRSLEEGCARLADALG